ncbi:MAG: carbohydrate ABC transporter permease [Clostridia bacterium]|nr:carbohydrate ABC transporter permease [Clostridia bacterium]
MKNENVKNKKKKFRLSVSSWILLVLLTIYAFSMVYLFLWGIGTSLKDHRNFLADPVGILPKGAPWEWAWSNYATVVKSFEVDAITPEGLTVYVGIDWQIVYTLLYAGGGAFVTTAACCIVGYMVSKFNYVFSRIVYTTVLVTMVIPVIGAAPSMVIFLRDLGLYDNYIGTYLMKFNFLSVYFLLVHASYVRISPEFSEAATIDGASELQIFTRIMIPMVMPTLSAIFLIYFIQYWNDYQTALLYMPSHPTLAYGVYYAALGNRDNSIARSDTFRLASCMIMALPILALFIALRDKIMGNVTAGGVKE